MPGLQYVGRSFPSSDLVIANKSFVDTYWDSVKVSQEYIDANMTALVGTLTDQAYVDSRDATKATKVYVDTQDALYTPAVQRDVPNGVAPLNAAVQVPAANIPAGILTDRVPIPFPAPTMLITGPRVVQDPGNSQEYLAATIDIPDPGYPYIPWVFGQVMGAGSNENDPGDGVGLGVYGQAVVFDSNNDIWARAATASNFQQQGFPLYPWALAGATPKTISGPTQLSLYLSLFSRSADVDFNDGYTFTNTGLVFSGLVMPGMT